MKNSRGFTLLEVMIAVTILAFIAMFTSRMIQQGVKAKGKIQAELDRSVGITGALNLMTRDIQQAFHYRDVNVELYNAAQKARQEKAKGGTKAPADENKTGDTNPPAEPPTNPDPAAADPNDPEKYKLKEERVYSRFIGEGEKLDFTSLNNFRGAKNLAQSDQAEVGYYLETCSGRLKKESSSQCLWRRVSPYLDDDVKDGGKRTVLLENVKSLKFRYLPLKAEDWLERWDSVAGDEISKNNFPAAVEVSLVVLDPKTTPPKEIAMTIVAPLYFPNNKPAETQSNAPVQPQ